MGHLEMRVYRTVVIEADDRGARNERALQKDETKAVLGESSR